MSKIYNRATGKFQKPAKWRKPAAQWWSEKLGIKAKGGKKGEGTGGRARRKAIDKRIKKAGG